jgi:hypothetical protein
MPVGDYYRIKAAYMEGRAKQEVNATARAQYERLAIGYSKLAHRADLNYGTRICDLPTTVRVQGEAASLDHLVSGEQSGWKRFCERRRSE